MTDRGIEAEFFLLTRSIQPSPFMKKFATEPGLPLPFGATVTPDGVNFAVFSRHATAVSLVLFVNDGKDTINSQTVELQLDPVLNKTGDVWHILVDGTIHNFTYCYRVNGPHDPTGTGLYFDPDTLLLDPYARALTNGEQWGGDGSRRANTRSSFERRCLVVTEHFDWEGDRPLNIPLKDSIIYELHVRGFTIHQCSGVAHPGTYRGLTEKIPYLQRLGITAVELMPVWEFNENENVNRDPTGRLLKNYWGYSPLAFFAPKASYASNGYLGTQVREFKEMVKALHRAGIEVILDVVFNHTAEGDSSGPTLSFRGLGNTIYYLLDPVTREYLNFSGCGNTLNCNHPLVRQLIMDCLHYWVIEMHVDGFRFDLASILGRDRNGIPLSNPPMVEKIAEDPILAKTKIIAEAWDAAGLYQVGSFSTSPRWAEWNGRFRDDVRTFMCGRKDTVSTLATRIAGSSDLYGQHSKRPFNSINLVTSHDGFTLYDLVSYNRKHNQDNRENNHDGSDHNISWNSGKEGETKSEQIQSLRLRRIRTFGVILFLSQGVPMLVAGDEFGRSQKGNNNAYCQDNEISWIDWRLAETNHALQRFFQELIALRKRHAIFRRPDFFPSPQQGSVREISWQSTRRDEEDWSPTCRTLAFFLHGGNGNGKHDDDFFVMLNGHRDQPAVFEVPPPPQVQQWLQIIDTAAAPPDDIVDERKGKLLGQGPSVVVAPMAAVVLVSKPES
jgi:isoamylase